MLGLNYASSDDEEEQGAEGSTIEQKSNVRMQYNVRKIETKNGKATNRNMGRENIYRNRIKLRMSARVRSTQ